MTKISWTDETWNPVTGCTKVSSGCANCYAEVMAKRFWGERKFTDVQCHPGRLDQPSRWKMSRRVFVNSMSDLFHEDVPNEFIGEVYDVINKYPKHIFQVLTKRPERAWAWNDIYCGNCTLPDNFWYGISAENQETLDDRWPWFTQMPCRIKFLSLEPLLSWIDLSGYEENVGWVIVGAESGRGARPMDIDWVRDIRDQCVAANIPFFFKQKMEGGKKIELPRLDGKVWKEYPNDN